MSIFVQEYDCLIKKKVHKAKKKPLAGNTAY